MFLTLNLPDDSKLSLHIKEIIEGQPINVPLRFIENGKLYTITKTFCHIW